MTSFPDHFRSREVTWHLFLSRDCQLLQVTDLSSSNVHKTWLIGLLQPHTGDFRLNDVTSGTLPVMWGQVTSFPATWPQPPASYRSVGAQTYPKLDIGLLLPLPGDFRSKDVTSGSLPVTWCHMTSFPVTWMPLPASYSPVRAQTYPKLDW